MLWTGLTMILEGVAAVTGASLAALYVWQNRLVYPAWVQGARQHVDTPDRYGLPYESLTLTARDGVRITAFDIRQPVGCGSNATVLILCPNAGNMGYFIPIADIFYRQMGLSVFIYSYRGYGHSEGKPSEAGLKLDADCVMDHLAHDPFHKCNKLVLFGRSLGGANAIYIAARYASVCDAVILENTFLSIPQVIPYVFPALRYFSGMCHEVWNSQELIKSCDPTVPFLFLSGLKDEIVPPAHMSGLYELCPSRNKQVFQFPLGYHNDTIVQEGYWSVVRGFLQEFAII